MREYVMGNGAIALGALAAGVNLVAGYPGTPSSEIIETIAKYPHDGVHLEWSVNEKSAMEVAASAAYSGARTMVTMKQMGLNVASDALMSLAYVGIEGGMVVVAADDPGPISSQTEQDTRRFADFCRIPVFDPASPEEAYEMVQDAFAYSEKYKTPVILRPTTRVCHAYASIDIEGDTAPKEYRGFVKDSGRWVIFPKLSNANHAMIEKRNVEIGKDFSSYRFNTIECGQAKGSRTHGTIQYGKDNVQEHYAGIDEAAGTSDTMSAKAAGSHERDSQNTAVKAVIASGVSYMYAKEVLEEYINSECGKTGENDYADNYSDGYSYVVKDGSDHISSGIKLIKIGTPFPQPEKFILKALEGVSDILCLEELSPYNEEQVLKIAGKYGIKINVSGRLDGAVPASGELSAASVRRIIGKFLRTDGISGEREVNIEVNVSDIPKLPARPPALCAGCPHRASFYAVKKAMKGRKSYFCGDIGCYTLGNAMPLDMVDTCLCMGAGVTMAQGFHWVDPDAVSFAFIGDSTFFASGMTGVVNAVYNEADMILCVLDNSTTAMTGHQPHPGTGLNMMGDVVEKVDIAKVLEGIGVREIITVDPLDLNASIKAVREYADLRGVRAIIFKSPCIALFKPEHKMHVDPDKCTSCKRCIKEMGCPALTTSRSSVVIDRDLCTGCGLCCEVCPADAIMSD